MVGNIGGDVKADAAKRIGAKSEAVPADNVAAEIESFQQSIEETKAKARANTNQGDALIAEGTNMVNEAEASDDGSLLGGVASAVPNAINSMVGGIPVLGEVTGMVSDLAQGVGDTASDLVEGVTGIFGFGVKKKRHLRHLLLQLLQTLFQKRHQKAQSAEPGSEKEDPKMMLQKR